jgi:hypothetical protein
MEMINLVEILKHCPKGMELHSTMFKNAKLKYVSEYNTAYPISIETQSGHTHYLTKYGQAICNDDAKCVIFPKNKLTWLGFQRPFKDGDIVFGRNSFCSYITIFKNHRDPSTFDYYVRFDSLGGFDINLATDKSNLRFATEIEKQKLFYEMKCRGYKWNEETKTLEKLIKPKFNVGDTIQNSEGYIVRITEVNQEDSFYEYLSTYVNGLGTIDFAEQDKWKLIPNKFDISTLVPFESKVLVRDSESEVWKPAIFGGYIDEREGCKYLVVGGIFYGYLIPYENNEHLRCKRNNCNPYYQTWNK